MHQPIDNTDFFGDGIEVNTPDASLEYEPRIDVSQAEQANAKLLQHVDRVCHEYPFDIEAFQSVMKSTDTYSLQIRLDYKIHGWCEFCAIGTDLCVHRISLMDDRFVEFVMQALWRTVTFTPKTDCPRPNVTIFWQEFAVDHFLFKQLLADGFAVTGLEPKMFHGYGEWWDGIKLEKQF
jgi:hypothetical protein